ncbi:MAG: hypothetical protein ACYCW6_10520 [Candidatus Xenobia bacterium]
MSLRTVKAHLTSPGQIAPDESWLDSGGSLLGAVQMWESEDPGGPHYELLHNAGYHRMGLSMGIEGIVNLQLA